MLAGLEAIMLERQPDWVLVYGDTNSTLAGALAACKLGIPLAHVEAGLRSFNRSMPEEHNRVVTDHCADLLFCPTPTAVANLGREGLGERVREVGDTMCDLLRRTVLLLEDRVTAVDRLSLTRGGYALATVHRAYNTDDPVRLRSLMRALGALDEPVVMPVHPRTRARLDEFAIFSSPERTPDNLVLIEPVGYMDMIALERSARIILTDSGGIQKEAFLLSVPCVTLRPETEWVETVDAGWNRVVGVDESSIRAAATATDWPTPPSPPLYGDGRAGARIAAHLSAESG
jgi:UDP-N-acetylglucosamine 2-epimerase